MHLSLLSRNYALTFLFIIPLAYNFNIYWTLLSCLSYSSVFAYWPLCFRFVLVNNFIIIINSVLNELNFRFVTRLLIRYLVRRILTFEYLVNRKYRVNYESLCRLTDLFPVRRVPFSRADDVIGLTKTSGRDTMASFAYNADVPYALVVALSLSVPLVIVSAV